MTRQFLWSFETSWRILSLLNMRIKSTWKDTCYESQDSKEIVIKSLQEIIYVILNKIIFLPLWDDFQQIPFPPNQAN